MFCFCKFTAISILPPNNMPCKLNNCKLKSKTNSKKRNIVLSCILNCFYLSFSSPLSKSSRNKNPVCINFHFIFLFKILAFYPENVHLASSCYTCMFQSLSYAKVRIFYIYVLSYNSYFYLLLKILKFFDHFFPFITLSSLLKF